ncbi:MAG: GAF domain-containing protein [Chloroflexaceae bacterium]|nr:GAF domain-containing protein [Chloroflexaceae bacterium]
MITNSTGHDGTQELLQGDQDDQLRRTSLLLQLSIEFRETLDPTVIVERMLQVMVHNLGITNASVVLIGVDGDVDLAISLLQSHIQQVTPMITRAVLDRGLAGWALRHSRSVVLPDVSRDKRWIPSAEWQRTGSALVLPIHHAQTTLGVLTVYHRLPTTLRAVTCSSWRGWPLRPGWRLVRPAATAKKAAAANRPWRYSR